MSRITAPVLAALVLTALGGCATTQRLAAAGDVHTLLVAIRDDDRPAFEAHVDRRALEAQIQSTVVQHTRAEDLGEAGAGLGLLLSGPLARAAGGVLIQPEVFRAVADYYGYRPDTPIPGALALATALSSLPDGRMCAKSGLITKDGKAGPCLLTFANEGGTWRLVAFDVDAVLPHRDGRGHP